MAFTHDPDDTCPFSDAAAYNAAMREVYGNAFEPVTDRQFLDLQSEATCDLASSGTLPRPRFVDKQAPPRPRVRPDVAARYQAAGVPATAPPRTEVSLPIRAPMSLAEKIKLGAAVVTAVGTLVVLGFVLLRRK